MGSATIQGTLWGMRPQDWAFRQEPFHEPLWRAMLHAAGVQPGMRVLDAGCGGGGACELIADLGAHVFGIDAAEPLVEIASARVPIGKFKQGDIEELPWPDGFFDRVLAANSIQFAESPRAALIELKRVCKTGGAIAVAVWGLPEQCDQRHVVAAVRSVLSNPPTGGGPFALSMPEVLEGLLQQAGIKVEQTGFLPCPFEYPDMETALRALLSAGPTQAAITQVGEESVREAVANALQQFQDEDGSISMMNNFKYVIGIRA